MSDPAPVEAAHASPKKRLLVVDDALIMRAIIKDIAIKAGWEIAGEAGSGAECVARYRELRPDLVTLDIVMPEMDGVEALRQLRREDPAARVVMVTAIDQRAKLSECIQLGALDFVVKPFDKQRLTSMLVQYGS
ncbi:MAG: response regulator [Planctomycetia bacterium]|nr:response regulator [Planctomycetia bacterium]